MSDGTTDLIVALTIVGVLFVALVVTMTLLSLMGRRDRGRKAVDIEAPKNTITIELAFLSDESSLAPVVQTPKPSVTKI